MHKKKKLTKWESFVRFLKINLWVFKIRVVGQGWFGFLNIFYKIFQKVSNVAYTFIYGLILNEIVSHITSGSKDYSTIYLLIGIRLGLQVFEGIIQVGMNLYNAVLARIPHRRYLQRLGIEKLIYLDWEKIETPESETQIQTATKDGVDSIYELAATQIEIVTLIITIVLSVSVAKISPIVLLLVFLSSLPQGIMSYFFVKVNYDLYKKSMPFTIRSSGLMGFFREFSTLYEAKASAIAKYLSDLKYRIDEDSRRAYLNVVNKFHLSGQLSKVFDSIMDTSITLYYLQQTLIGKLQLGTLTSTITIISQVRWSFSSLLGQLTDILQNYQYVETTYEFLQQKNARPDGTIVATGEVFNFEFIDVWFRYPGTKRYALKNINIAISDNSRLAIVGENGAGKSTFLKLLLRSYVPTKGVILLNGININDYTNDSLHKSISLLTQDFSRLNVLSIKENIGVGAPENIHNTNQIIRAAQLADADKFISKLPNKYDTFLTKKLEGGTELSTGQWQKIAVARQFFSNRPLVVLDEPTASIDPIAESKIFNNLYEHVKDKTVIVVSHRYNTVRAAKKILVFNDGQIIEQGNHEELLALNGYYAKAFEVQQEEKKL